MTLSGFNQEGGKVIGNVQNLTIESKQNTSITTGSTIRRSLSIAPNGMPSGSTNYSQTNGERRVVDNPTTFIIGDGSNLKIGKVEEKKDCIWFSIIKLCKKNTCYELLWHEDIGNIIYSLEQDEDIVNELELRLQKVLDVLNIKILESN